MSSTRIRAPGPFRETSIATRRAILPELVDRDVLVACGHYPGTGIGRVVTRDGRVVWEESR